MNMLMSVLSVCRSNWKPYRVLLRRCGDLQRHRMRRTFFWPYLNFIRSVPCLKSQTLGVCGPFQNLPNRSPCPSRRHWFSKLHVCITKHWLHKSWLFVLLSKLCEFGKYT